MKQKFLHELSEIKQKRDGVIVMKNEKLSKVNERLNELEMKKDNLQNEVNEILQAVEDSVQAYAMGDVDELTVQKAKSILEAKTTEIKETEEMIQRVKGVRKSVLIESIPFINSDRDKKVEAIQKEVDNAVKEALEAREVYTRKLAAVGQARNKVNAASVEYNDLMRELGERPFEEQVKVPSVYPETITIGMHLSQVEEKTALGLSKATQEAAAKRGILPQWVGGVK
ncbi:UNVERIFIED_ORG: DNA repair exonuclease SbcCD ATPase subunit [Bacillus sp. B2I3]|nr:DNA repair exonuclease SbcCD ATPase subunit [Bacillus sp. B2I3]